MKLDSSRSLLARLVTLAVLVLLPPLGLITMRAMAQFEQGMAPEMDRKAAAIGHDLAAQIGRALDYAIPLDKLVGMDPFFAQVLAANPEIRYLAVTDGGGSVLYVSGVDAATLAPTLATTKGVTGEAGGRTTQVGPFVDLALPLEATMARDAMAEGRRPAEIHVGFATDYVMTRLRDILADIGVMAAVALIIAFEILLFFVIYNISGPMKLVAEGIDHGRRGDFSTLPKPSSDDEVGRFVSTVSAAIRRVDESYRRLLAYIDEVRTGHFDQTVCEKVAAIADRVRYLYRFDPTGMPRPLRERLSSDVRLPLFLFVLAEEMSRSFLPLYAQGMAPGQDMAAAATIAAFMAAVAAASAWAGAITEKLGSRRVFLLGLAPAVIGSLASGLTTQVGALIAWRAVAGLGYALVTVACQSYIAHTSGADHGQRARGLGVYVGAVLTAGLCGSAGGAILADRLGQHTTFWISAVLIAGSGLLLNRLLGAPEADPVPARPQAAAARFWRIFANWRFSVLMVFAAIPAKMALTGFLFFLAPVMLWRQDFTVPEIGRVMALYPLVMLAVSALANRLADVQGWRLGQVALGGMIGGVGLLAPLAGDGLGPVMAAIVALGVAHGMSASPQLALLPDICWTECHAFGSTRVLALVRTLERVGSALGPLLAAAMLLAWGPGPAAIGLGVLVLVPGVVFALAAGAYGRGPHLETEEDAP